MCTPAISHAPAVRVRFDAEQNGSVVDLEIATSRVDALVVAVMRAARELHSVIERLELRPRHDRLHARIVVASDPTMRERQDFVGAMLEATRVAMAEPIAA